MLLITLPFLRVRVSMPRGTGAAVLREQPYYGSSRGDSVVLVQAVLRGYRPAIESAGLAGD